MLPEAFLLELAPYVNPNEVQILLAIGTGLTRQENIALYVGVTQPTVSRRIQSLASKGYVKVTRTDGVTLPNGWPGLITSIERNITQRSDRLREALQALAAAVPAVQHATPQ